MNRVLVAALVVSLLAVVAVIWSMPSATPEARRAARRARLGELPTPPPDAPEPDETAPAPQAPPPPRSPPPRRTDRRAVRAKAPARMVEPPPVVVPMQADPEPREVQRARAKVKQYLEAIDRSQGSAWAESTREAVNQAFESLETGDMGLELAMCGGGQCIITLRLMDGVDAESRLTALLDKLDGLELDEAMVSPDADNEIIILAREPE